MKNSNIYSIILGILLLVALAFIFKQCEDTENLKKFQKQNILALETQSKQYKDAYDNIVAVRHTFIGNNEELLKLYDSTLYKRLQAFRKTIIDGEVIYVTNTKMDIKGFTNDSTETKHDFYGTGGKFSFKFLSEDSTHSKVLEGFTTYKLVKDSTNFIIIPEKTKIILDYLSFTLETYFVKNEDGTYTTMARTPYKNINLVQSGAVLKPEIFLQPDRTNFSIGLQSGLGFGFYGVTPYVGVGISYNIYNF